MWVRGHSRSLKVVPFKSLGTVSYSPSIVTMAVSAAILEIFSVKEWPDLDIFVWGPSRSLRMAPFDRPRMTVLVSHCNYSSILYHLQVSELFDATSTNSEVNNDELHLFIMMMVSKL